MKTFRLKFYRCSFFLIKKICWVKVKLHKINKTLFHLKSRQNNYFIKSCLLPSAKYTRRIASGSDEIFLREFMALSIKSLPIVSSKLSAPHTLTTFGKRTKFRVRRYSILALDINKKLSIYNKILNEYIIIYCSTVYNYALARY